MASELFVSIIIPAYNAAKHIDRCLTAIKASSYPSYEIIVVDDGSTDDSIHIARKMGATVFQMPHQSGPAAARNLGAEKAKGNILFFVDADVLIQRETVARVASDFQQNPDIVAVFGSYDDSPAESNFLSQYKNLFHHFVHQQASAEAMTFWAGCGAIRRELFQKIGGFDQERYRRPEIEDIELGYRMRRMGYRILLDKDLQVKHLKLWRFVSLLRADIVYRAIPWTKLILERRQMINDLNIQTSDRISAGLVGLSLGILPFSFFIPRLLYSVFLLLAVIFFLNYKVYRFFLNQRGVKFAALVFPMHLLYYLYSGVTFVLCWMMYVFNGRR